MQICEAFVMFCLLCAPACVQGGAPSAKTCQVKSIRLNTIPRLRDDREADEGRYQATSLKRRGLLHEEEWNVPVRSTWELDQGGIAIAGENEIQQPTKTAELNRSHQSPSECPGE